MSKTCFTNQHNIGWWQPENTAPALGYAAIHDALCQLHRPIFITDIDGQLGICQDGTISIGPKAAPRKNGYPLQAYAPALPPESLGDPLFKKNHFLRYPYVAGAMANGITSVDMVKAMGRAGMIGFFGAGGLSLSHIEAAIDQLQASLKSEPYGFNLIHSPYDPALEAATVDLYIARNVKRVSAAAFLDITLPLVHYRVKGIHQNSQGNIVCPNKIIAKVSRIEVARKFFSPPSEKFLSRLVETGSITRKEAELARLIPLASDLTAEADSGGHTDNRPAISLFPTMLALRDEMNGKFQYHRPLCVGLAGGIATPSSVAAAFAMGAAYVLTGTVNQACMESGTSKAVRDMLTEARQADVTMAPSADMFEMGVKVQVLKRGTMFPLRATKLYELYCQYDAVDHIPAEKRHILERDYFRQSCEAQWEQTKLFFEARDPLQLERAESDPKHKMSLIFRSYLGQSSLWAKTGDPTRKIDYQIWCGPAIGAFNQWAQGTFLARPENRKVVLIALNLLIGASVVTRRNWLCNQGVVLSPRVGHFKPQPLSKLKQMIGENHLSETDALKHAYC